jgi:hypothetical protein
MSVVACCRRSLRTSRAAAAATAMLPPATPPTVPAPAHHASPNVRCRRSNHASLLNSLPQFSCSSPHMQRADVDLRALVVSGKDAAQKMEDALARLLRQAASGADNSKHFETIVSCCDAKQPLALRSCAFSLVSSCCLYDGDCWGKLVKAVISEALPPPPLSTCSGIALMPHLQVKAACSGATGAERTAACAVRALASVPCAWLQAHTYDLCDVLRDAASR